MTKMNFNGQWIDNLYVDPHRGLGPGVENTTVKVGQSTGETFLHSTKNKRTIAVDYQIYGSTRRELELTLADKLYTDDVVPIIFSDKPNEVWYGKLDKLPTMEKPGVSATGTFSLLVPDGLSHALTPTTATNENSDGTFADTIELTNNGTVPTPLHVTAEMLSDNGFLGLTLDDNQPYQVGNPDEIDGVTYDNSQMLVPAMPALADYAINDAKYQVIPPSQGIMKQQGSLKQTSDKHISAKDFGPTPAVKGPRGPAMTYTLPADNEGNKGAKNWTFRVHDGFGSLRNKPREVGQLCATVLDINGKSIASIIVADLSQTGNEFLLRFDVNQEQKYLKRMTWKDAEGSGFTSHYYIRKSGNQFTFGWAHDPKSYTYMCDELTDTEAYYVSFSFLKWMDVPTPAYYGLINWNFRKDMVDEFKNLPNYFTDGDLVNLDSKTNTLTINDYPDWDRVDIASEPLLLPPGKSTLGIVYSTFAKPPKVTVDFEERWL